MCVKISENPFLLHRRSWGFSGSAVLLLLLLHITCPKPSSCTTSGTMQNAAYVIFRVTSILACRGAYGKYAALEEEAASVSFRMKTQHKRRKRRAH